jgi:hypothetical protein
MLQAAKSSTISRLARLNRTTTRISAGKSRSVNRQVTKTSTECGMPSLVQTEDMWNSDMFFTRYCRSVCKWPPTYWQVYATPYSSSSSYSYHRRSRRQIQHQHHYCSGHLSRHEYHNCSLFLPLHFTVIAVSTSPSLLARQPPDLTIVCVPSPPTAQPREKQGMSLELW